jgi:hypothetical protein
MNCTASPDIIFDASGRITRCNLPALVHEVYLKLIDQQRVQWQDRDHFFAVASQMIRRILVSHDRAHKAAKRGAGVTKLLFDEAIGLPVVRARIWWHWTTP